MNFILISSLQHIAVAKIATTLWNKREIMNLMKTFCSSFNSKDSDKKWLKVEYSVMEKVLELPLPELLKEKVLIAIKPVGTLILKWITCYAKIFSDIDMPQEFCWTSRGILDEIETAKLLIKDKNIIIKRRYKISCIYCLEDNVKELWNESTKDNKKSICSEINPFKTLVSFWTYFINGGYFNNSGYFLMCQHICQSRYRVTAEYFFKKLHSSARNAVLHSLASKIRNTNNVSLHKLLCDITLSLLLHASKEQQIEFFQICPSAVLVCLLDWPWQSFFTQTVHYLKTCLPEDRFNNNFYDCLLRKIISKILYGYRDFSYQNLLEEYWQKSSDQGKMYFLHGNRTVCLLSNLFAMKDMDIIKMILHYAAISVELFRITERICIDMIENEKWDLLKFFLQESALSKIEMLKFKEDMKIYMTQLLTYDTTFARKIAKWNIFFFSNRRNYS